MRRPGTNPADVRMTDVLCDFCRREWQEQEPMIEGHQGSCICGTCLRQAYAEVVVEGRGGGAGDYTCPMCLEGPKDRAALGRADEPGWRGPHGEGVVVCRRCIELAAKALGRSKDFDWTAPS